MKKFLLFTFMIFMTKKINSINFRNSYISLNEGKIKELEAVIDELREINVQVIEQLAKCKINFNFSKMDIKNSGSNPCFDQNMDFDLKY